MIFLVLGLSLQTAFAQVGVPSAPTWLQVQGVSSSGEDLGKHHDVSISWRHGKVDAQHPRASEFVLSRTDLTLSDPKNAFVVIATLSATGDIFSYVDKGLRCGEYQYRVEGRYNGIVGEPSPDISAIVRGTTCAPGGVDARYISFTTYPNTVAVPGKTFEYVAQAKHSIPGEQAFIRYRMVTGPDGMSIDSLTGKVTWLVPIGETNSDVIKIRAYHATKDSETGDQKWWFRYASKADLEVLDPTSIDEDSDELVDRRSQLTISPNPASDQCQLKFRGTGSDGVIEIIASNGTIVKTMTIKTTSGYNTQSILLGSIPSGAYIVRVVIGGVAQESSLQVLR